MDSTTLHIWTDGACVGGNPGFGGWAYVKQLGDRRATKSDHTPARTTNICMEMVAVLQALRGLKRPELPVVIYSDCQMIPRGLNEWMPKWQSNGWIGSNRQPVANRTIWQAINAELEQRPGGRASVTFEWVKGHSGNPGNELADELAEGAARKAQARHSGPHHAPGVFDPAAGLIVPDPFADLA